MKRRYALGFMFSESRLMCALIRKARPVWQAGKFNGIGGKVNLGETVDQAMRREFREETGVDHEEWDLCLELGSPHFEMGVYRAFTNKVNQVRSVTDEKVSLLSVNQARHMMIHYPDQFISNMQWIFPYVLDGDDKHVGTSPIGGKILY